MRTPSLVLALVLASCREGEPVWHQTSTCADASCQPTSCTIGGETFDADEPNPANPCQSCQPARAASDWIAITDGTGCGAGQRCYAGACAVCPPGMAAIDHGSFVHHSDEPPLTVGDFCIDLFEVTVAEYRRCVDAKECETPAHKAASACNWGRVDHAQHPVNCVSARQAKNFCRWAGKRLPTDAEWMWTARRQAEGSTYPWGEDPPRDQLCWSGVSARSETCAVGSFRAGDNPQGVHDLSGNVDEWVDTGSPAPLLLGGNFGSDQPAYVSSEYSIGVMDADTSFDSTGFRCVLDR